MENFTIAKNTTYQSVARISSSIIGFLITITVARHFGVLSFGDFIKITSYVAIFYLIVDFGLNAFFLQIGKIRFKDLFYLRLLISFFVFLSLNILAFLLPNNLVTGSGFSGFVKIGIFIFSLSVFSQGIITSAAAVFQKTLNYYHYMLGIILGSIINLILIVTLVSLNFSLFYIILSFILSSFLTGFILLFFLRQNLLPVHLDLKFAKDILLKSWPVGLMLIFNLIYFRADILLLSFLSTTKDVGIYGLSYKFFDFLIAIPLFLSNAVYPYLLQQKNSTNLSALIKKYILVFLTLSIIIAIPFWFISPLFSFIKSEFAISIVPFRILLISLPLFFITSFFQWVLITKQKQMYLMYVYLFCLIINITLNILLIPQFSYIASASITVVSEGLVFILLLWRILPFVTEKNPERTF